MQNGQARATAPTKVNSERRHSGNAECLGAQRAAGQGCAHPSDAGTGHGTAASDSPVLQQAAAAGKRRKLTPVCRLPTPARRDRHRAHPRYTRVPSGPRTAWREPRRSVRPPRPREGEDEDPPGPEDRAPLHPPPPHAERTSTAAGVAQLLEHQLLQGVVHVENAFHLRGRAVREAGTGSGPGRPPSPGHPSAPG